MRKKQYNISVGLPPNLHTEYPGGFMPRPADWTTVSLTNYIAIRGIRSVMLKKNIQ